MVITVISGGQTGVDQAALRAALRSGLAIGGWCPPGRLCEDGKIPDDLPLRETLQERSPDAPEITRSQRTAWNVRDSDATLVLKPAAGIAADVGTDYTQRCAALYGRPLLICDPRDPGAAAAILRWLGEAPISRLNVAGPSEGASPGVGEKAYLLLLEVFGAQHLKS